MKLPNFTFRDPTLLSAQANGTRVRGWFDYNTAFSTFFAGRYGPASGWQEDTSLFTSFHAGTMSLLRPFDGSTVENVPASTTFQAGTYFLALVDNGTFAIESGLVSSSFGTGRYSQIAVISDGGTDSGQISSTFQTGAHSQVIVMSGSAPSDAGLASASILNGTSSLVGAGDPLYLKAIIRFTAENGNAIATLDYTTVGAINAYTFSYEAGNYMVLDTTDGVLTLDQPFFGDSFDNRYAVIADAPVFPPPPPPPPGIVIITNGTGSNIFNVVVDNASGTGTFAGAPGLRDANAYASFQTGSHLLMRISEDIPLETTPAFATFLSGDHRFIRSSGSSSDAAFSAATFGTGYYVQVMKTAGSNDSSAGAATFLSGLHVLPQLYATADSTIITADGTNFKADNCKPFSFDGTNNGYGPTFDNDIVFNFSQE